MSKRRSYVAAAFNARPFGMPVPPNWFGLAVFGLLGGFLNPGFWLIGAGLELAYLWLLSRQPRFRALVDAGQDGSDSPWMNRYHALLERLDGVSCRQQDRLEARCREIITNLQPMNGVDVQVSGLTQLCWLHLRLLVARAAVLQVVAAGRRDRGGLLEQQRRAESRLAEGELDDDLRRSLEQQLGIIRSRLQAHGEAEQRLELVDAELERIRQQVALVHEQALLATDAEGIARSVDVLAASLNEANRWLQDQHEVLGGLDDLGMEPPPAAFFQAAPDMGKKRGLRESS